MRWVCACTTATTGAAGRAHLRALLGAEVAGGDDPVAQRRHLGDSEAASRVQGTLLRLRSRARTLRACALRQRTPLHGLQRRELLLPAAETPGARSLRAGR